MKRNDDLIAALEELDLGNIAERVQAGEFKGEDGKSELVREIQAITENGAKPNTESLLTRIVDGQFD